MNHLSILEHMRRSDTDFQKLFPQNNNGIFWLMADESTMKWDDSGWIKTKPQYLDLVEPHPRADDSYIVHTQGGRCTISRVSLNNCFNGYPAVYTEALAATNDPRTATELAAVAWLQQYRLTDTVITPDADGTSWNIHDKLEYSIHGESSSCIYVMHETLMSLYPHARNIFEHIRSLGLTSLDVEELLQSTTILRRLDISVAHTSGQALLPMDISV